MPNGLIQFELNNRMKNNIVLILILLLIGSNAAGEFRAPEFRFEHINTDQGLPSNRVRDIVQDDEGFMWFATDGGLVRYDGNKTKIFVPYSPVNPEKEIFVMKLATYKGGLLIGTDNGLFSYDPYKESLEILPVLYNDNIRDRISGLIHSIAVDSKGVLWISVENKGVFKISNDGEVTNNYKFPEVNNNISKIFIDGSDIVWCISNTQNGDVFKLDSRNSKFKSFPITVKGKQKKFGGTSMMCDVNGDYWLGTWESGLLKFNGRNGEGKIFCEDEKMPAWHIHSITQYNPGMLLVGSDSGLMLFDVNSGEYKLYHPDELDPESLSGRFIYPVTKDSEGGIWIGTFYRGVNYLSKSVGRFNKWQHSRFTNSVSGNVVSRICEDKEGCIWVGSADGGLSRFDPRKREFRHYPLSGIMETDNINALGADGDKLWVGTYSKGTGVLDISTGKWKPIEVEGTNNTSCYAICIDSNGRVWGSATETLTLYNPKKEVFETVSNLKAWINDIEEDSNGNLWISTQGSGLFRYNPVTEKWVNYKATGKEGSLLHNHINSISIFEGNDVLVATPAGVCHYLPGKDTFVPLEGFPEGLSAYSIEKSGIYYWISTKKGLVSLPQDGKPKIYTVSDGLSDNQFMPGASCHASDGTIYYGSIKGFSGVNPLNAVEKETAPKIKFTSLDIINEPVEVGDPHLPSSLNSIDKLVLGSGDHTFTIYFSALSYSNPQNNDYLYQLEGFDKTWHDPGKDRRATYSNLPPGTYTFRVKAANADGVWNDEGISLKIEVKPVWYLSTLMKLLYLVCILGFILLATRYVLWRMEKSHASELERISNNQEKEMFRSKLKFFTVVAHEIRTPVSLIIGPLEKVLESQEKFSPKIKDSLNVIDRNAHHLLSLVNQLLDYKKVEDNALPVGFRREEIIPIIENILLRFKPTMEQKGIKLLTNFPDPKMEVDVDPEAITKLVSNLLNNAMKFTKDSIKVSCEIIPDSNFFNISVADNGIGISKENREKIFNPFFQVMDNINDTKGGTGLGLSIVKSVVEAHGGEIKLESEPGKGSIFTVILPIRHKDTLVISKNKEFADSGEDFELSRSTNIDDSENPKNPVLLIVDDNPEMVDFISSHYETRYDVLVASNGKEALEKMKTSQVSLIISDWMMPEMDGEEFLKKVRKDENYSHIPFVMLTAKTDNVSKISTMKSGADAYVEKPFSIGYLDARIENLLEMRELLRKKYSRSPLEPITTIAQTQVDNELLTKLQRLIEENFSNPNLSVDFLADRLAISRSGLYSKIRALADVTPNELIQITRLKKAAELLAENKYRINEICYMVGFNSSSYFSRCFHKQFGMNPGEFAAKSH